MNKRNVFLWCLYDFANSMVVVTFFLYFSQWLVVEKGLSDIWFNMIFVGSSLLFLLTAPVCAAVADKVKRRMPGLRATTLLSAIFFGAAAWIASYSPQNFIWAAVCFCLANYFYQFSFVYYNPLLAEISTEKNQGMISGWGQFANFAGNIAGLVIAVMFAKSGVALWGLEPGRTQTLIPATLIFVALALPMVLLFKESSKRVKVTIDYRKEYKEAFTLARKLFLIPGLGLFLGAYFFFNDALLTFINNFPIYMQKVYAADDGIKTILVSVVILLCGVGALIAGRLTDVIGPRKVLMAVLFLWCPIFPMVAFAPGIVFFGALLLVVGFLFGATWTVSRTVVLRLAPPERLNHSFAFYTLMERFATFVGPVAWGLITTRVTTENFMNYKMAALSLTVFIVIGFLMTLGVKLPERAR